MAAREEADLKERIEGLRTFERDYRSRLSAFVKSQLELLEAKPMITAGAPLTTGGRWDRPKPSVFDTPLPKPAPKPSPEPSSWLSLSDKPSTVETPPKREAPEAAKPEAAQKEVEAAAPERAAPEPGEPAKPKSKVENRTIRELFWGDD
jgi:hypothetical protein